MNLYFIGQVTELKGTFRDDSGALIDPPVVKCSVLPPDGISVDVSGGIVRVSLGVYTVEYTPTQIGLYEYRFVGTLLDATPMTASEAQFMTTTDFGA